MATEENGKARSLEPPSLKLGRKKKGDRQPAAPARAPQADPAPTAQPAPTARPAPEAEVAASAGPQGPDPTPTRPAPAVRPTPAVAAPEAAAEPTTPAPQERPSPTLTLPQLAGPLAAAITGAVVAGVLLGLTWASLGLCESVSGTSSCGGAGFPLLLLVVAAAVLAGAFLLHAFGVPSAGSISFLAVALVAVLAMAFFADELDQGWIVLAIPVLTIAAFVLAHTVTVRYIDPAGD